MTKAFQKFGKFAIAFALVTSGAVGAGAQRKAPSVEPSVAESVQQEQAPRIRLPQQQPAPAAPQLEAPVAVDVSANQLRLPQSRLSNRQRKQLAEGLAQQAITGLGRPTFVEYDKLQVSVPRKVETSINRNTALKKGKGLDFLTNWNVNQNGTVSVSRPFSGGDVAVKIFTPAGNDIEYYLVEVHYKAKPTECESRLCRLHPDVTKAEFSFSYFLNDAVQRAPVPVLQQPEGVFTFLMDPTNSFPHSEGQESSFIVAGRRVEIKAIEVRPVR